MKTLTLLKKARKVISKEENWTRGELARNFNGGAAVPNSTDAVCWCSMGAMRKFVELDFITPALDELILAMPIGYRQSVVTFEDSHTHAEVLALFDKAIENLSSKN